MKNDNKLKNNIDTDNERILYILHCRYYKGEEESPFAVGYESSTYWNIERMWVEHSIRNTDIIRSTIEDYVAIGLEEFEQHDGTPVSLKAFLMNRLFKYSEREDVDAFKETYLKSYRGTARRSEPKTRKELIAIGKPCNECVSCLLWNACNAPEPKVESMKKARAQGWCRYYFESSMGDVRDVVAKVWSEAK